MIPAKRERVNPDHIPTVAEALTRDTSRLSRAHLEPLLVELVVSFWPPSIVATCSPYMAAGRAVSRLLTWLEDHPGETWQDRWDVSAAAPGGWDWFDHAGFNRPSHRDEVRYAVNALIVIEAVTPSMEWLFNTRLQRLWGDWAVYHDNDLFDRLLALLDSTEDGHTISRVYSNIARTCIATGKSMGELTREDFLSTRAYLIESNRQTRTLNSAWYYIRQLGLLPDEPFDLPVLRGQLSPEELVDRYPIKSAMARAAFVEYLTERAAEVDYSTLEARTRHLVRDFWCDLEQHHPGIDTFTLSREQIDGWRERLKTLPDGRERTEAWNVLGMVRTFYLDVAEWAQEDPGRWIAWVAPSPISARPQPGKEKARRRHNSKMKDRTRQLAPLLPQFVAHVTGQQRRASALLAAATSTVPGEHFTFEDHEWTRYASQGAGTWKRRKTSILALDPSGDRVDISALEERSFWTWAATEVLRLSGLRIEEMLELTHLSIQAFRKPDHSLVPILQVAPSKTDRERVIPVDPDLAHVLALIVSRHVTRSTTSTVPLLARYDGPQRTHSPPMPFLFQRTWISGRPQMLSDAGLRNWLTDAANSTRIRDASGKEMHFTPHDFRRLWITEGLRDGIPIHIVAEMAGHQDLNTTNGYNAVYPSDVIDAHDSWVRKRRELRADAEEYRKPTPEELKGFIDHFGKRRVELGDCMRPYGTNCIHQHACLRCDFLAIDAAAAPRLDRIEGNVTAQLTAAKDNKWLCDVEQLQLTLGSLHDKREGLQARSKRGTDELTFEHTQPIELRLPSPDPTA